MFAALPLNLTASESDVVDHIVTGSWSKKAVEESQKYCKARAVLLLLLPWGGWRPGRQRLRGAERPCAAFSAAPQPHRTPHRDPTHSRPPASPPS